MWKRTCRQVGALEVEPGPGIVQNRERAWCSVVIAAWSRRTKPERIHIKAVRHMPQLLVPTKMFCDCAGPAADNTPESQPNTHVCPVCAGEPGALPRPSSAAVEIGGRVALALGCTIAPTLAWDRKSYFYADNPKVGRESSASHDR